MPIKIDAILKAKGFCLKQKFLLPWQQDVPTLTHYLKFLENFTSSHPQFIFHLMETTQWTKHMHIKFVY